MGGGVGSGGGGGGGSEKAATGRMAFRRKVEERLLPALRAHCPDLIILSAGFDGGKHDVGNEGLPKGAPGILQQGLDLTPADFEWLTTRLCHVAKICCNGRVVSVLEGGYGSWEKRNAKVADILKAGGPRKINRDSLARNAAAHIGALRS